MLHLDVGAGASGRLYRLAGRSVIASPRPSLAPFAAPDPVPPTIPAELPDGPTPRVSDHFSGLAWVGGRQRCVLQRVDRRGDSWLEIDGGGRWWVDAAGSVARRRDREPFEAGLTEDEVVLGPVLLLALGLGGVFCLHASAVTTSDGRGAVAFVGPSGVGKSTLAAAFGPRRLGDDVLPVTLEDDRPVVLPRFPQLKLDPSAQPGPDTPERLPLVALLLLEPEAGDVALRPLAAPRDELSALIRHTLAGRLFPFPALELQLDFVSAVAQQVPVRVLEVPWGRASLPRVVTGIDAWLRQEAAS